MNLVQIQKKTSREQPKSAPRSMLKTSRSVEKGALGSQNVFLQAEDIHNVKRIPFEQIIFFQKNYTVTKKTQRWTLWSPLFFFAIKHSFVPT